MIHFYYFLFLYNGVQSLNETEMRERMDAVVLRKLCPVSCYKRLTHDQRKRAHSTRRLATHAFGVGANRILDE